MLFCVFWRFGFHLFYVATKLRTVPYSRFFATFDGSYGAQRDHHSIDFNPVQRRFTAILYGASRESLIPFNALKPSSMPQTHQPPNQESESQGQQGPTRDTTQPITTIAECVSRLQISRSWHGNKVGEAEFERDAKAHAEKHDLKRHAPSASKNNVSAGPTQVVVQNVATFKDVVFLRDVASGAVHSVVTEAMKNEMIRRGFEVVCVTHHTDATTLPMPSSIATGPQTVEAILQALPPSELKISLNAGGPKAKNTIGLWKPKEDEVTAVSIVRAVEEKYVDPNGLATIRIYSPLRLWDKDSRNSERHRIIDSKLTQYFKAYFAIRGIRKCADPSSLNKATVSELTKEASEYQKSNPNLFNNKEWREVANDIFLSKPWVAN